MVWPLVLYWKIWKSDIKTKQKKLEEYGLLTHKEFWSSSLTLQQKDQIFSGVHQRTEIKGQITALNPGKHSKLKEYRQNHFPGSEVAGDGNVGHSNANNLQRLLPGCSMKDSQQPTLRITLPLPATTFMGFTHRNLQRKERSTPSSDMDKVTNAIPYKALDPVGGGKFLTSNSSSHSLIDLRPTKRLALTELWDKSNYKQIFQMRRVLQNI